MPGALIDLVARQLYVAVNQLSATNGHCYGMVFTAQRYYENPDSIPLGRESASRLAHPEKSTGGREPAVGSDIDHYQNKQFLSPYSWLGRRRAYGLGDIDYRAEVATITAAVGEYGTAGITVFNPNSLYSHQVLVYGYERDAEGITFRIYDPNVPAPDYARGGTRTLRVDDTLRERPRPRGLPDRGPRARRRRVNASESLRGAFIGPASARHMRQFIVLGHDVPTDPEFSLDDLAGGAGRLDVLCRCVNSAFFLSHAIREDVRVHLILADEFTVRFEGGELRRLNPDERSTAALIRGALERREEAIGHMPAESSPGVSIRRMGFEETLSAVAAEATVVQLHEEGDPVVDLDPPSDPAFVLSDHHDFGAEEESLLAEAADERVRLGPELLHADHAITVAHNYLDTDGFVRY